MLLASWNCSNDVVVDSAVCEVAAEVFLKAFFSGYVCGLWTQAGCGTCWWIFQLNSVYWHCLLLRSAVPSWEDLVVDFAVVPIVVAAGKWPSVFRPGFVRDRQRCRYARPDCRIA